jgi:hypothetical protein
MPSEESNSHPAESLPPALSQAEKDKIRLALRRGREEFDRAANQPLNPFNVSQVNSSAHEPAPKPPVNPVPIWRRWAVVIATGVIILTGAGYAATQFFGQKPTKSLQAPTAATVDPAITSDKIASPQLPNTDLSVTSVSAQNSVLVNLLASALQVSGNAIIQGDATVAGNGTYGGTIQAANFNGNGAGLTGVNAT